MVEHLLSALFSLGIDNVRIEVEGSEIPAGDGSAQHFVDLIERAHTKVLEAPRSYISIAAPLFWSEGDVHLIALPSSEFRLSYTLHYPQSPILRSQYFSFSMDPEQFKKRLPLAGHFLFMRKFFRLSRRDGLKEGDSKMP